MKKTLRVIVEIDTDNGISERDLKDRVTKALRTTTIWHEEPRVKGFNAVMCREVNWGATERRRLDAKTAPQRRKKTRVQARKTARR